MTAHFSFFSAWNDPERVDPHTATSIDNRNAVGRSAHIPTFWGAVCVEHHYLAESPPAHLTRHSGSSCTCLVSATTWYQVHGRYTVVVCTSECTFYVWRAFEKFPLVFTVLSAPPHTITRPFHLFPSPPFYPKPRHTNFLSPSDKTRLGLVGKKRLPKKK